MKVFLDANVLVSVLNKEYPVFAYSSRLLSLCDHPRYKLYTSPLCLGIAWYFAEKKSGAAARDKIRLLASKIQVTAVDADTVKAAASNKKIHDFEDGLEYYAAINTGCSLIVTEDKNDFYFSAIDVLTSREFMEQYIL